MSNKFTKVDTLENQTLQRQSLIDHHNLEQPWATPRLSKMAVFGTYFWCPAWSPSRYQIAANMAPKWSQTGTPKSHFLQNANINSGCYLLYFGYIEPSGAGPKMNEKRIPQERKQAEPNRWEICFKKDPKTRYPFSRKFHDFVGKSREWPKWGPRGH